MKKTVITYYAVAYSEFTSIASRKHPVKVKQANDETHANRICQGWKKKNPLLFVKVQRVLSLEDAQQSPQEARTIEKGL